MILYKSFTRELRYTFSAIFLTLFILTSSIIFARILGQASAGSIAPQDVIVILALTGLSMLPMILSLSLFISVMVVLTRWYKDSEMVVWRTSGLSLSMLIPPLMQFAIPVVLIIFMSTFWLRPWSFQQIGLLKSIFTQSDGLNLITAGQFQTLKGRKLTYFVGNIDHDTQRIEDVFVSNHQKKSLEIAVAQSGSIKTDSAGNTYLSLYEGKRYQEKPQTHDLGILQFSEYAFKIHQNPPDLGEDSIKSSSFERLMTLGTNGAYAELSWRISILILAILSSISALALAYQNQRQSQNIRSVMAILLLVFYNTMISIAEVQINKGRLSFWLGLMMPHIIYGVITVGLFYYRSLGYWPPAQWLHSKLTWAR